jgi:hypothetical protein
MQMIRHDDILVELNVRILRGQPPPHIIDDRLELRIQEEKISILNNQRNEVPTLFRIIPLPKPD